MSAKKKSKPRRNRPPTDGQMWEFHGSYTSKAKAEAKARARGGWFIKRMMRTGSGPIQIRYVVLTSGAPF